MQSKQPQGNKSTNRRPSFACSAIIDGHDVTVTGKTLKSANWTDHHGTTANGNKVMSLRSTQIGGTIIIQKANGAKMAYSLDEAEVFARDLLGGLGYSWTAPANA